jgi:hypothetical protein
VAEPPWFKGLAKEDPVAPEADLGKIAGAVGIVLSPLPRSCFHPRFASKQ